MSNGNDRNVKNEKGHSTPRDSKNMHSEEDNSTSAVSYTHLTLPTTPYV